MDGPFSSHLIPKWPAANQQESRKFVVGSAFGENLRINKRANKFPKSHIKLCAYVSINNFEQKYILFFQFIERKGLQYLLDMQRQKNRIQLHHWMIIVYLIESCSQQIEDNLVRKPNILFYQNRHRYLKSTDEQKIETYYVLRSKNDQKFINTGKS